MKNKSLILIASALLVVAVSGLARSAGDVQVPFELGKGEILYEKYCSSCHGVQLNGTDKGPPLIHPFYKPSHHGDRAFYNAALKGTRQHHWEFGDMPPVVGMAQKKWIAWYHSYVTTRNRKGSTSGIAVSFYSDPNYSFWQLQGFEANI